MPMQNFLDRIRNMNQTFEIPCNDTPTHLGTERLRDFEHILKEEMEELADIAYPGRDVQSDEDKLEQMVNLADYLGDNVVYSFSEAQRWGIPLDRVLDAIMDSMDSKLVDGKPLKDERQKFIKGPNFVPPEPKIRQILTGDEPSTPT